MVPLVQTSYTTNPEEGDGKGESQQNEPAVATYFDEKISIPQQESVSIWYTSKCFTIILGKYLKVILYEIIFLVADCI